MKSILLDPDTLQRDTEFSERLGKRTKLAQNAFTTGAHTYTDPDTGDVFNVEKIRIFNSNTRKFEEVPGIMLIMGDLLWECWYGGITTRGNEYFKFRITAPLIAPSDDGKSPNGQDTVIGTGQIFVNQVQGRSTYDMVIRDTAASAELKMGEALLAAGVSMDTIIKASQTLTTADFNQSISYTNRNSGVNYKTS